MNYDSGDSASTIDEADIPDRPIRFFPMPISRWQIACVMPPAAKSTPQSVAVLAISKANELHFEPFTQLLSQQRSLLRWSSEKDPIEVSSFLKYRHNTSILRANSSAQSAISLSNGDFSDAQIFISRNERTYGVLVPEHKCGRTKAVSKCPTQTWCIRLHY